VALAAWIVCGCGGGAAAANGDDGGRRGAPSGGLGGELRCVRAGEAPVPSRAWFRDVSADVGVARAALPSAPGATWRGVSAGDLDGDGAVDLVVAAGAVEGQRGPTRWLQNAGALRFRLMAQELAAGQVVALADLDNDGDLDLVAGGTTVSLQENLGDGRFGAPSVLATLAHPALSVTAGDIDGDGWLDLAVGGQFELRVLANRRALAFADAAPSWSLALEPRGYVYSALIFDVDEDGAADLFVGFDNDAADYGRGPAADARGGDALFLRRGPADGAPAFQDLAAMYGVRGPRAAMGASVGDFDGDGRLDLYLSNIGRNHLLLRGADGRFTYSSDALGLDATRRVDGACPATSEAETCFNTSWMSQWVDFDGDGADDLAVAQAKFSQDPQRPLFFQGDGRGGFARVTPGVDCFASRTLLAVDLDGDTDPDLVAMNSYGELVVARNETQSPPRRCVALRGTASNREGRGARVTAVASSGRRVPRVVAPGGGVFGDGPATLCFGAASDPPVRFEVRWPSGRTQSVDARAGSQTVTEPG
jgi:hypothetical protein